MSTVFTDVSPRIVSSEPAEMINEQVFGKKLGIFTRIFGCRHTNVGRPFSHGRSGYRACINCGARRQFDPNTLETFGNFYAPPAAVVRHF